MTLQEARDSTGKYRVQDDSKLNVPFSKRNKDQKGFSGRRAIVKEGLNDNDD